MNGDFQRSKSRESSSGLAESRRWSTSPAAVLPRAMGCAVLPPTCWCRPHHCKATPPPQHPFPRHEMDTHTIINWLILRETHYRPSFHWFVVSCLVNYIFLMKSDSRVEAIVFGGRVIKRGRQTTCIQLLSIKPFRTSVLVHRHNVCIWGSVNHQAFLEHERYFSKINVLCYLTRECIIKPFYFLKILLTGLTFLIF